MTETPILETLRALAALAVGDDDLAETAEGVVALACDTLDCQHAGLTVFRAGGSFETLAHSQSSPSISPPWRWTRLGVEIFQVPGRSSRKVKPRRLRRAVSSRHLRSSGSPHCEAMSLRQSP